MFGLIALVFMKVSCDCSLTSSTDGGANHFSICISTRQSIGRNFVRKSDKGVIFFIFVEVLRSSNKMPDMNQRGKCIMY